MSLLKSNITKNFSVLTATNLIMQVLAILTSIRMARELQPDGYGIFNLVLVQTTIFSLIATFGLKTVVIRYLARNKHEFKKIFSLSNHIRLVSSLVATIVVIIYNTIEIQNTISVYLIASVIILILLQTFWDSIESVFFGLEKMEVSGYTNLGFTIAWIAWVYALPSHLFTVQNILMCYIANQFLKTLFYYFWFRFKILKTSTEVVQISKEDYSFILKQSSSYFLLAVFSAIQNQIPILLLQVNSTFDQIGLFNLGNRILSPLQIMLNMLLMALFPMLSRIAISNRDLFAKRIISLLNIMVITGICGSICFSLFSKDVVRLLYGEAFIGSANIILVQCWFTVLFAIFCTIGTVLSALDKQKLLAKLSLIYAISASPIFYIGSKYGAIGLSWSFVIAGFVNMTYHWVIFNNILNKQISYIYAFILFTVLGLLTVSTYYDILDFGFWYKIGLAITLASALVVYIYKYEIPKIQATITSA